MSEIVPAILPKTVDELEEKDSLLNQDILFHLDVVGDDIWTTEIHRPFEVHLMIADPDEYIERWVSRGAQRIIVHSLTDKVISFQGEIELGLGINMDIDLESIADDIREVDFMHLMSISEIGEQGHPLDENIFDKIRDARALYPDKLISVDGGIDLGNAEDLVVAGADRLIVGSVIFEDSDPQEAYDEFQEILNG